MTEAIHSTPPTPPLEYRTEHDSSYEVVVLDYNYGTEMLGDYKFISSDGVAFFFHENELRQSTVLCDMMAAAVAPENRTLELVDPEIERAICIRLLLGLMRDLRLDGERLESWPLLSEMVQTLHLAQKWEFNLVYKMLVGHIEVKLLHHNYGSHALRVFSAAVEVDDDVLAKFAVEAMEQNADDNLRCTAWHAREIHDDLHLAGMQYYPGTWTADEFDRLPRAHIWALVRAMLPRVVPYPALVATNNAKELAPGTGSEAFLHYLQLYRAMERNRSERDRHFDSGARL